MDLTTKKSTLNGTVNIPGSKSHTIRAVAIASLADGVSHIRGPLDSSDTQAAVETYRVLGATIDQREDAWHVTGTNGKLTAPSDTIDVGNSGTTIRIAMGSCALIPEGTVTLTGDEQIQGRPAQPLADALNDLGATITNLNGTDCPPFTIQGRIQGGETSIECKTSQYLSSLLMACPLADNDTHIKVPLLNEAPYVGITLDWLDRQGIKIDYAEDYSEFHVPGRQTYQPVNRLIPADFSSATFFLAAGALAGNDITSNALDYTDTQGDKAVVEYLHSLGAKVTVNETSVHVTNAPLTGCEIDMNATPDALPMMAVLGCFTQGETRLVNVPQARMKETDRIAVMAQELTKIGADIEELPDGLIIRQSQLKPGTVQGHGDHRVIMSLAIAGTQINGGVHIQGADAMSVTYPTFAQDLASIGGNVKITD
jgi:3-phosphoshikimate 1-carboxyvinyltransferase